MSKPASPHDHFAEARALLEWYAAAGVDEAVLEDRQAWDSLTQLDARKFLNIKAAAPKRQASSSPPQPPPNAPPIRPQTQHSLLDAPTNPDMLEARTQAANCHSLADLRTLLEGFDGCRLKATATKLCFYRGADKSNIMFIGEAPGRDEDLAGEPFVGRAGQLLDKMLAAINLSAENVHITNTVYWRPPGNRTPTPEETQMCWPFLERQITLVEPDYLLLMGGAATKTILSTQQGIMKLRGKWHELKLGGRDLKILPSLHPAYLLRTPAAKRLAWRDLLSFENALKEDQPQ